MSWQPYSKLKKGDSGYIIPSTRLYEGEIGVVADVYPDNPPHFKLEFPDGSVSNWLDYGSVGAGGRPPRSIATSAIALVKWLYDPAIRAAPPPEDAHREWSIEQVSDTLPYIPGDLEICWALVRDEWTGRLHWLYKNAEYSFVVSGEARHKVVLEGIPQGL